MKARAMRGKEKMISFSRDLRTHIPPQCLRGVKRKFLQLLYFFDAQSGYLSNFDNAHTLLLKF